MALPEELREALADWAQALRAEAEADEWDRISVDLGYEWEGYDPAEGGPELVEQLIRAVTFVLSMRFMHAVVDQEMLDEALAFVKAQAYGLENAERSAVYSLRFMGLVKDVELFVPRIGFVDLEDFVEVFPFMALAVRRLGGRIELDEAKEIVKAIYEDLTYDGDEWDLTVELTSYGELVIEVQEGAAE